MDIVLIPCWRRADFLTVTLRRIVAAADPRRHFIVFLVDQGAWPSVRRVARGCPLRHEVLEARERPMHGNSYNVLRGYAHALAIAPAMKAKLVYLVEEDIFVAGDFFDFHEAAHARFPSCFFVSAVRNQNDSRPLPPDRARIYLHRSYQSLGVSFGTEVVRRIVVHHNADFYRDPLAYVSRLWPHSERKPANCEQDGVIDRIVEAERSAGVYPFVPRAFHAGFVGYHRRGRSFGGSLAERVAKLERMTDAEANRRAHDYKDIETCDLRRHCVPPLVIDRAISLID